MRALLQQPQLSQLLERCRRQDSRAWAQLVDQYRMLVYSVARRHGLNSEDAEDVFVSTFEILLKSLDRIETPEALPKWLAVTAGRESLRLRRLSQRYPEIDSSTLPLEEIIENEEQRADAIAISALRSKQVRSALERIDPRCRELLRKLYFEESTSYSDISAELGMPVGAIGPTRARCLEKLRSNLARRLVRKK